MNSYSSLISINFNQHACTIPSKILGMQVFESPNLTVVDSGLPCDTFNIVHIRDDNTLTEDELTAVKNHFDAQQSPYCIWISEYGLTDAVRTTFNRLGIAEAGGEPGMVLNLDVYQPIADAKHQHARIATTAQEVADFAEVVARNWTPTDQNVIAYYQQTASEYLSPENRIVLTIYYHEGQPVSVIELFPSDTETVGLYCLATLDDYRGKGIGTALMTYALNLAKELGYKSVILQASEDGLRIYQRLGFSVATVYYEFQ